MEHSKKFLEFNGKVISFLSKDGQYWVALKPICDALEVDYFNQFKRLKKDPILYQLLSDQTMVARDGKLRQMASLPEKFVYGWLFSINSDSPELIRYKRECYEILFDHFHGAITQRSRFLQEKTQAQMELEKLEADLQEDHRYQRLMELKSIQKAANKQLNALDKDLIQDQLELWNPKP